jgi:2-polyprenyl-3-methyl-5-hydroxy-6-metoxy-1,4-benzoquinol methylase
MQNQPHHTTPNEQSELQDMLRVNEEQKKYYEQADGVGESEVNGFATNLWRRWRSKALSVYSEEDMNESLAQVHLQWLRDRMPGAKVLDLGLGYGNPLTMRLARAAREFVAIDLSSTVVDWFNSRLKTTNLTHARAEVADILSDDFKERNFDIVYARAVFHHFKYFDAFLHNLSERLAPGGVVVTLDDPLETWLPMKILRGAYRPFQTDASWEWPFTSASLATIERNFQVTRILGTYGASKWAIPLGFVAPSLAKKYAAQWHQRDLVRQHTMKTVRSCLRVSMLLNKKL